MDLIEFDGLLTLSAPHKSLQLKVVQLQIDQPEGPVDKIYFGDADKVVHASLLESALKREKISCLDTERLGDNKEVRARRGEGYVCVGMGRCRATIAISSKSNLYLFNFFGNSEYNMMIDPDRIETRVHSYRGRFDDVSVERQTARGLYQWHTSEISLIVKLRKIRSKGIGIDA